MTHRVRVTLDDARHVLYAKRDGAEIVRSREAPHDCSVIMNYDGAGAVVGVQVMSATERQGSWSRHPDRGQLPPDILAVVDDWLTR